MATRPTQIDRLQRSAVGRVVLSRRQIAGRVGQLGRQIAASYEGSELTVLTVLTGGMVFLADLIRRTPLALRLQWACLSSYPGTATQSRGPRLVLPPQADLQGRHVLVVDDILDTGGTIASLLTLVRSQQPRSLRTCFLLRKAIEAPGRVEADFVGFDVPDEFLIGYGLDYDGLYRNLPDICVLDATACEPAGRGEPRTEGARGQTSPPLFPPSGPPLAGGSSP